MKLVVFGLTVSSSWGNGHATLWRGLVRALGRAGHRVVFYERDMPWYAAHRDLHALDGGELRLYADWPDVAEEARRAVREADAAMVTSYCPDARAATALVLSASRLPVFYDLDTPVTLAELDAGREVGWVGPRGYRDFALVLSFTGGRSLEALRHRLGARWAEPLYGSVDPEVHRPLDRDDRPAGALACPRGTGALSYLGTYAADRQGRLEQLFLEPARRLPERCFLLAGALYPDTLVWPENVRRIEHLPPAAHPGFYATCPLTLNVTRGAMVASGWCPSPRLFEAAAAGVPLLSDAWDGLASFFTPGEEILVARDTEEALAALSLGPTELGRIGRAARARVLRDHTAERRAGELLELVAAASRPRAAQARSP